MIDAFRSWQLQSADNPFDALLASVRFEDVTTGRRGTVVVAPGERGVPIVRTTTPYRAAPRRFGPEVSRIAQQIRESGTLAHAFDNALVEHYTSAYSKMKQHSDQALDLADGSTIAVYSCYRDPAQPSRRLIVKSKDFDEGEVGPGGEVPLDHDSVVAFTLDTNRRFTHAIALRAKAPANDWLGITFRTSKTFVRFVDGQPTLDDGVRLTLADDEQRRAFLQMRRRENAEIDFVYPAISYTLGESDLCAPE